MFIQVIQGKTNDKDALQARFDGWREKVMPGAEGFQGSTGGVTADGEVFLGARFESDEAAQRNSDRPEQSQWWEETSKLFDGEPRFTNYTNVEIQRDGGSDDAGFVQVIQGRVKDIDRVRELDKEFDMSQLRPDVIGGYTGWAEDGDYTSVVYFTSEAAAREGEKKEPPAEMKAVMEEWMSLMGSDTKFMDLTDPWMASK